MVLRQLCKKGTCVSSRRNPGDDPASLLRPITLTGTLFDLAAGKICARAASFLDAAGCTPHEERHPISTKARLALARLL
jgi:hypothetical protein